MTHCTSALLLLAAEGTGGPEAPAAPAANPFGMLVPMVLILVLFFWLTHRSQKKRDREREQMLDGIKPKDKVVTIGGIHGRVVNVQDDTLVVRIDGDKDVRITINRTGVARKVSDEKEENYQQ